MNIQEENPSVDNWKVVPGWNGTTQKYVDLDTDRWIQENGIREAGYADGKQNFPQSDADQPNQMYMKIIEWVNKRAKTCHESVSNYLVQQRYALEIESNEEMALLQHKVRELKDQGVRELSDQGEKHQSVLARKEREARDSWEALETFRAKAELDRVAEYNEKDTWYWWLIGIIAIEAVVNAMMLADLHEQGWLGAITVMLAIGVVNAGFLGFMLGEGWRRTNSIILSQKISGLMMVSIGSIGMVFWNLLVGHFRDSITDLKELSETNTTSERLMDEAVEDFLRAPFGIESVESWVLVLIGVGCCVFAASKWLNRDDLYPGYGAMHRAATEHNEEYNQEVLQRQNDLNAVYQAWVERINKERNKLQNKRDNNELINQTAKEIVRQLRTELSQYQRDLDSILAAYRSENEKVRTTDPPKFFSERYTIDLDMLELPVWEGYSPAKPDWDAFNHFHQANNAILEAYKKAQDRYPKLKNLIAREDELQQ